MDLIVLPTLFIIARMAERSIRMNTGLILAITFATISAILDIAAFRLAGGAFKDDLLKTVLFLAMGLMGWIFAGLSVKWAQSLEWGMLLWMGIFITGVVVFSLISGYKPTSVAILLFAIGTIALASFLWITRAKLAG